MVEDARQVFGARAGWYATSQVHKDPAALARLVAWASPAADARVLDVGAGAGHTAFAFAPHVAHVIATDPTRAMLEEALRIRGARGIPNVDVVLADAQDLPFRDGGFDLVTCRRAAHHVPDLARGLREMRRVLRPGGRLLIDDRSVPEDDLADALQNALDVLHDPSHVRERRPSEWRALLSDAGFHLERLETYEESRPFSSFTESARPDDVLRLEAAAAAWGPAERKALGARDVGGVLHTTHWFVTVLARAARSGERRCSRRDAGAAERPGG